MIDSHCHLAYKGIIEDLDNKLKYAQTEGVEYFLTVSTRYDNIEENIKIAEKYSNVFCSIGVHPMEFYSGYDLGQMKIWAQSPKVVAIGEVGLEYHYEGVPHNEQKKMFRDMLQLAEETNLPVILHLRECFDDGLFDILSDYKVNAVFHCYSDSLENAKRAINAGYYISFSGIVTFKNADELRKVAQYVPDDRFLIETDCPFLTPVPFRGKPNEPGFVRYVAECVAHQRNISLDKLTALTNASFFKLFPKSSSR